MRSVKYLIIFQKISKFPNSSFIWMLLLITEWKVSVFENTDQKNSFHENTDNFHAVNNRFMLLKYGKIYILKKLTTLLHPTIDPGQYLIVTWCQIDVSRSFRRREKTLRRVVLCFMLNTHLQPIFKRFFRTLEIRKCLFYSVSKFWVVTN